MLRIPRVAAYATMAVLAAGCGRSIEVQTMAAPDAGLASLHAFRMLPGPARRDGRVPSGEDDPMISNSIANQSLRERIARAFQDRGYTLDERNPDFGVAFYATSREKLDATTWDYGYPFDPRWGRYGPPMQTVTQYTEGSVIIDVVTSVASTTIVVAAIMPRRRHAHQPASPTAATPGTSRPTCWRRPSTIRWRRRSV